MESNTETRRSLLLLLVGTVAVVTLLTLWVGWALPLVIFAIIFIVMAHEFGHFITAKRAGMKVTYFFVGCGPVIWSTTIGETRYGVRAILAGGYVKVPGMTWTEEIPEAEEKRTYRSASYPKKVLFASAGSLMHVLMALILAWVALTFIVSPSRFHHRGEAFYSLARHAVEWPHNQRRRQETAGSRVHRHRSGRPHSAHLALRGDPRLLYPSR